MSNSVIQPIGLALLSAFFHAVSHVCVRAGIKNTTIAQALLLSLTTNVVVFWAVTVFFTRTTVNLWQWRYFIIAGLFAPIVGRFFNYSGIKKLGVNLSVPITHAFPVVSVILAILFLGEQFTFARLMGAGLIILGGITLSSQRGHHGTSVDKKYLILPIVAALAYGGSDLFRKLGISIVASPLLAAAVTASTSWIVLVVYLVVSRYHWSVYPNRREIGFFVAAGLATSLAIPVYYLALQNGEVMVLSPVNNTSPLMVFVISWLFFRKEEIFSLRVIGGTAFIVLGVILLVVFSKLGVPR